jgi:ArsR family transcriptional regulator
METAGGTMTVERMFAALADRTRLRILCLLVAGELCVCDLVRVLEMSQPKVSRHLAYLRRTGLVRGRKEGLWMYYKLAPARSAFHKKMMECLGCCFGDVKEVAGDARRRAACCGGGSCCDGEV